MSRGGQVKKTKNKFEPHIQLLKNFCQALTEIYAMDTLAPGITLSYLPNGHWYASVCRYDKASAGPSRTVMLNVEGPSLTECLDELVLQWRQGNKSTIKFIGETLRTPILSGQPEKKILINTRPKRRYTRKAKVRR